MFNRLASSWSPYFYRSAIISGMSIVDKAMKRGGFCGAYGVRMLSEGPPDCKMVYGEATYHRITSVSADSRGSTTEKSSDASWIAVQGKDCMCFVTWNRENSVEPDFTNIFFTPFEEPFEVPKVKVSLKLGTKEVNIGNGCAASFAEYNEIAVVYYLRRKLKEKPHSTYRETLEMAIDVFGRLFPVSIKANEIKLFVWRKGEQHVKLLPVGEVKNLLDVCKRCNQESLALFNL